MKYKAVLFDFDGLMFETEKLWKEYNNQANIVFNVDFTEEHRNKIVGKHEQEIRKVIKELFPDLDVDAYREWLREKVFYHQWNLPVAPKKGLVELLKFIKQKNLRAAIVSGSETHVIENMLKKNNISSSYFQAMVTGNMQITPKPSPDVYLLACKNLGVKPEEAIVLEDSYNGIKAGKSAGCLSIMIPDTFPVNDEMRDTADLILNDLNEVIDFLQDKV